MVPKTEGGEAGAESKKKGKKKSKEKTGESCASCPSSALYLSYRMSSLYTHTLPQRGGAAEQVAYLPVEHHSCGMASQQLNVCTAGAPATASVISECCSSCLSEFPIALQMEDLHPQGW